MKTVIQTDVTICSAHRLLLDYESKCSNLHGHNWNVRIRLEGETNDCGMLIDFVKVKSLILDRYDHKTVLCQNDPFIDFLKRAGVDVVVMPKNPTAENLCEEISEYINSFLKTLPNSVRVSEITVEETANNYAEGRAE